ncbi:nuclear transport factor 2 family protein [Zavarzinia compransoris]|uniref:nuclear transport factor 2 family protein n=1 Tax=Zavarzinia marina TaxID=2911065 RepID=UPI001F242A11|nr:nuclear transport factor 2 family protein [Zavarzinia marina]MCF4166839.1 nuclear transport factor 2 family protein [Zavarzinia marina]
MYHAIVRAKVRQLFGAVNRGDAGPVLNTFARRFEHRFLGETALGGTRSSLATTRLWYERLYRLLPDIHFDLGTITVAGAPWNTLVSVDWVESNSGTDGVRTTNRGIHVMHLRWGRAVCLTICPDTVGLAATLARLAAHGEAEATAPPITDLLSAS